VRAVLRLPAGAALALCMTACATLEAEKSSSSDGGSYQLNAPGGLVRAQLAVPSITSKTVTTQAASSSDWEYGVGFHAAPAISTNSPGLTIHPMVSYAYLKFDGGHDDRILFGGQVRKALSSAMTAPWIGAEAAAGFIRTHIDDIDDTDNTGGFSVSALGGIPVSESRWRASLFAGVGYSYFDGGGINLRVGLDLQPGFMKTWNGKR